MMVGRQSMAALKGCLVTLRNVLEMDDREPDQRYFIDGSPVSRRRWRNSVWGGLHRLEMELLRLEQSAGMRKDG